MNWITSLNDLHDLYDRPKTPAIAKVTPHLTPAYAAFIDRARFCILTTVGPEGTDCSPRGDEGPVATALGPQTLAIPDWSGNQRLDSLRNIVRDPRVSLLFLINGSSTTIRVNGTARLTDDAPLRQKIARPTAAGDLLPKTVIVIRLAEVYSQCARALQRSELWTAGDGSAALPTAGQMLQDATAGAISGAAYDADRANSAHLGWW